MDLHDAIWKSIFLAYQKTRGESWSIEKLAKSEIRLTRALHRMETLGLDSTKNVSINNCKRLSFVEV